MSSLSEQEKGIYRAMKNAGTVKNEKDFLKMVSDSRA